MSAVERTVEISAVFILLMAGLTQVYATRAWGAYYRWLAARREPAVRLHGFIGAVLGGAILWLHSVWSGAGMLLTFVGGFLAAEGAMCLVLPRFTLVKLAVLDDAAKARTLFFTGVSLIIVSGVLTAHLLWSHG